MARVLPNASAPPPAEVDPVTGEAALTPGVRVDMTDPKKAKRQQLIDQGDHTPVPCAHRAVHAVAVTRQATGPLRPDDLT